MSVFDDLGVPGKLAIPSFLKFGLARSRAWVREIRSREQRPPECFSMSEGYFPIEIPAKPGKILAIRELHVVSERVLFLKVLDLRIKSQRVGKNLCAKATSPGENCEIFSIVSFLSSVFRARLT
jgi:hypothetical protein